MAKRNRTPKEPDVVDVEPEATEGEPTFEFKAKGKAKKLRAAMKELGGDERNGGDPDGPDDEPRERERRHAKLLAEARNTIVVHRTQPRTFDGQNCAIEVFRERGPMGLEELKSVVFAEHGGWKYRVSVVGADGVEVDAFTIENPSTTEPIVAPLGIDDGRDPFAVEVPKEPLEVVQERLSKQVDVLTKEQEIEALQETIENLKERRRAGRGGARDDEHVRALERRIEQLQQKSLQDMIDAKLRAIEAKLEQGQTALARPAYDPEKEELKRRLADLERRAQDTKQDSLVQTLIAENGRMHSEMMKCLIEVKSGGGKSPASDLDSDIERLVRLKSAFFGNDGDKAAKVEDLIYDLALSQLTGARNGGGAGEEDDEDTMKFAIKQLMPVLKDLVKRESDNQRAQGKVIDEETHRRIVAQEAKKVALELEARMRKERQLPAQSQQGQQPQAKPQAAQIQQQQPAPQPAPQAQVAPQAPTADAAAAADDEPLELKQPEPAAPGEPGYDRKKAVDFVLAQLWYEIQQGCPTESIAVGDALDFWDDGLLDGMLAVETADQMQALLRPYAEPTVWENVEAAAKSDPVVKAWLRRLVVTLQGAYAKERQTPQEPNARPTERF